MIEVAFDLRWPPVVTFDDQAGRDAVERHRGREMLCDTGRQLRTVVDVRQNVLGGQPRAAAETGERDARAGESHKLAPVEHVALGAFGVECPT